MSEISIPLVFIVLMIGATVLLGIAATRKAKTAADFYVAARSVGVAMNASAISGEYLSAASFMGIAGLIMKNGYDALWYPVGYAAGYLLLLLFIAGPLRRFGAFTIPDFAQGRFDSPAFRKIAVIFVLFIGFFYTMPQMKGAGITMGTILGWPYWVGIVVVGSVITFNVALGGMKGITLVQAFQYWAKLFAISVPLFVLMAVFGSYNNSLRSVAGHPKDSARIDTMEPATVNGSEKAPLNALSMSAAESTVIDLEAGHHYRIAKIGPARKPEPGEDPIPLAKLVRPIKNGDDGDAVRESVLSGKPFDIDTGVILACNPVPVTKGGLPVEKDGKPVMTAAKIEFAVGGPVTFPAVSGQSLHGKAKMVTGNDAIVPNAPPNGKWANPYGPMSSKWGYPVLYTYSLIIALVCGTAGLPHILVRFYTNPDGRSAKRTTLWVMVMLGVFYVFTPVWGVMGRLRMPQLYVNGGFDAAVIKLPTLLDNKLLGDILSGVTSAGAFAAFMSTFSGLLVSMSGAFAHDIYGRILRPDATPQARLVAFKVAAVGVGIVSMLLGLLVETFDIATMVGWAFAIGAASYFPLLLLGSWWRGLTKHGAAAGMLLGGLSSVAAIVLNMLLDKKVLTMDLPPLVRSVMEQPAIWAVPLSIGTMIVVSKATADKIPADVTLKMIRLHAPEEIGHSVDYISG
ncbi:MAG: cation acetate symporter [Fimbriimonas sp.]|nr:cation acetate symporter [Fimbriimonas sp.]